MTTLATHRPEAGCCALTPCEIAPLPVPVIRPFGTVLTVEGVQEVWDAFVVPLQRSHAPLSVEARALMAILRSTRKALSDLEAARG